MKKDVLCLFIFSLLLTSCDDYYKVTSDFTYKDENVQIGDTLESVNNKKAHVVFLYGQSNADGCSSCEYLKKKDIETYNEYLNGYSNVYINFVNDGGNNSSNYTFTKCTLGCGFNLDNFGPEAGIADIMHKSFPNENTFIVKWTWGATTLRDKWLDNHHGRGELYNSAMDFSLKCLDYLKNKGYTLSLDGICWMQGESDSYNDDTLAYYRDTVAFATQLRYDFKKYQKKIKFIDAGINEDKGMWLYPKAINDAKKRFAKRSSLNYFVDTNALGISTRTEPEDIPDYGHYDSVSMVKLGQEFGKIAAK